MRRDSTEWFDPEYRETNYMNPDPGDNRTKLRAGDATWYDTYTTQPPREAPPPDTARGLLTRRIKPARGRLLVTELPRLPGVLWGKRHLTQAGPSGLANQTLRTLRQEMRDTAMVITMAGAPTGTTISCPYEIY